ncbi:MAG TPA: ATP phosphoribosyltransferase regulatory subunit, partial [Candidatus Krumholzibacteria bacterium]
MAKRIEPKLVKGMRDQLGAQLRQRRAMTATISTVFERFGFTPLETPALEFVETLTGAKAGETGQRIYTWSHEEDGVELGLRFDLTVPLARFVAAHPEVRRPFKRYQTGSVFRVDKPGAGRFREFTQFDIDVVGTPSMLADAEIMVAMATALRELGLPEHSILWNHRGILNAALNKSGVEPKRATAVIRVLDKADKIGHDGVLAELGDGRVDGESGARIEGLGLPRSQIEGIAGFLAIEAGSDDALVDAVRAHLMGVKGAADPIREMEDLREYLRALGENGDSVRFDPRLARGMDYYTGPIFEATL